MPVELNIQQKGFVVGCLWSIQDDCLVFYRNDVLYDQAKFIVLLCKVIADASLTFFAALITLLVALEMCLAPQYAWASEKSDIPQGVLTLCDDPFSIEDDRVATAPSSEQASVIEDVQNDSVEMDNSELTAPSEQDSQELASVNEQPAHETAESDEARLQQTMQSEPPSTHADFSEESTSSNSIEISSASTDASTIVVVDDEGLRPHEQASVLAKIAAGMPRSTFDSLIDSVGGLDASSVTDDDLVYGLVKLKILGGSTILETIERIKEITGFIDAQPNYVYSTGDEEDSYTIVDDKYATRQWGLYSMNTYAAWDLARTQGSVAVAVIDTGADLDHPDLQQNIIATYNSVSTGNTVEDQIGHGTHVAGIIAGVANNSIGVAGSSYNANLVIIKAAPYKSNDFDTASLVRAYAWLASRDSTGMTVAEHYNVRVVNMSIGGLDETRVSNMPDDLLNRAMLKARDEQGILTVVAAGNGLWLELPYFSYPGDSDASLCVMNLCESYNDNGEPVGVELDRSSNYNMQGTDYKDICAPGTDIYSTWINGKYAIDSGTSMAAPMVSGVAALLFAANPTLSPLECMGVLEASATDLGDEGWDEKHGYGAVNAAAAVRMVNAARVDGWDVVGIGDTIPFTAHLGWGMEEDVNGWTWNIWLGEGGGTMSSDGELIGWAEGDVTVVATCTATTGAQISAIKNVHVIDAEIIGDNAVAVGECSSAFTTDDPRWTWVWKIEDGTGSAHIDQDAIMHAERPGTVYVTATCASNTSIVLYHEVTITA